MKTYIMLSVIQVMLLAFQGMLYLGVQYFQGSYHDMARPVDKKIPLVPQAAFIYILWYPLIAVYPLYLYSCSELDYYLYIFTIVVDIAVSTVIYLKYPTSFQRPVPPTEMISGKILKLLYKANYKGLNCTPSMHCSMCFIIIFSAFSCGGMDSIIQISIGILACGILCSTVLTKQHVAIDVATALPLAIFCWCTGNIVLKFLIN